jgi:hypothetical protein
MEKVSKQDIYGALKSIVNLMEEEQEKNKSKVNLDCIYCKIDPHSSKLITCNEAHGERELIESCPEKCTTYCKSIKSKSVLSGIVSTDKTMNNIYEILLSFNENSNAVKNMLGLLNEGFIKVNKILDKMNERINNLEDKMVDN